MLDFMNTYRLRQIVSAKINPQTTVQVSGKDAGRVARSLSSQGVKAIVKTGSDRAYFLVLCDWLKGDRAAIKKGVSDARLALTMNGQAIIEVGQTQLSESEITAELRRIFRQVRPVQVDGAQAYYVLVSVRSAFSQRRLAHSGR